MGSRRNNRHQQTPQHVRLQLPSASSRNRCQHHASTRRHLDRRWGNVAALAATQTRTPRTDSRLPRRPPHTQPRRRPPRLNLRKQAPRVDRQHTVPRQPTDRAQPLARQQGQRRESAARVAPSATQAADSSLVADGAERYEPVKLAGRRSRNDATPSR